MAQAWRAYLAAGLVHHSLPENQLLTQNKKMLASWGLDPIPTQKPRYHHRGLAIALPALLSSVCLWSQIFQLSSWSAFSNSLSHWFSPTVRLLSKAVNIAVHTNSQQVFNRNFKVLLSKGMKEILVNA